MRAAWWWIDRWRKSTAYTDMTAEEIDRAARLSEPPAWYRTPTKPPPDVDMMQETELDRLAREDNVQKYDYSADIWGKRAKLKEFYRTR